MAALILSVLSGVAGALFSLGYKLGGRQALPYDELLFVFSAAYALFAAAAIAVFAEPWWDLAALFHGSVLALSTWGAIRIYFVVTAAARLNVTWLVIQFSILIPFGVSVLLYHESLSVASIAGVALLFAAMLMFGLARGGGGGSAVVPAPRLAVGLAVSTILSGISSAAPRMYTAARPGGGVFTLLLWQGIVSTAVTAAVWLWRRARTGAPPLKVAGVALYMSFFNIAAAALLVVALRGLDGAVVFPVRAVGNVLAVFALSFVFFGERVRRLEAIAAAVAVAGIALVSATLGGAR
jgi:drug/metabolite transporter (DMT)-like permease